MRDTLRAGATAFGVAAGLLALASTAQTPDGYIHARFGGPLDVFSTGSADVLAIGDGNNDAAELDATELAALLKGPVGPAVKDGLPNSPYRVAYEAGAAPNATTGAPAIEAPGTITALPPADPTAAPTHKDAAILPSKPVVDSQGHINCSGAVSCRTDPATNITTVTYPDGVIAIVQKVNDLTVVAYKTLTEALPAEISSWLPAVPTAPPPLMAAVAPSPEPAAPELGPVVASTPAATPSPAPEETTSASIDPGPPAPDIDLSTSDDGPRVNVTRPPDDFSPGHSESGTGTGVQTPKVPDLGKVKDTIGGVVDAVKGAVGKALGPGAASTPDSSGGSQDSTPENSRSDTSGGNDSGGDKSGGGGSDGS